MQDYQEKLSELKNQLKVYREGKIDDVTRISWEIDFETILRMTFEDSKKGQRILDVGCGPGGYLIALSERKRECYGVDPLKDLSLAKANKKAKEKKTPIFLCQATGEYLPFRSGVFDLVLCLSTLQHVSDQKRTLHEISRVLKDDGYLLTSIPTTKNIHTMFRRSIPESFTVAYTVAEIEELLVDAKFRILEIRGSGFFPPFLTKILRFYNAIFKDKITRQLLEILNGIADSWLASAGNIIALCRKSIHEKSESTPLH
jgi:ubiquinone/menaquinone biosynthesis C-methylase UbiE